MNKRFLELGRVVSTHGIRGEMRIQPWCNDLSLLKQIKRAYLAPDGDFLDVTGLRPHGNVVILKAQGIDSIEKAETFRGKVLYLDKESVTLSEGEYFAQDIIGCSVYDDADGAFLGEVCDVSETGANDVWHIKTPEGKEVLIPKIPHVVKSVDIAAKSVTVFKMRGLFDDED